MPKKKRSAPRYDTHACLHPGKILALTHLRHAIQVCKVHEYSSIVNIQAISSTPLESLVLSHYFSLQRMSVYKKPTTTAMDVRFASDDRMSARVLKHTAADDHDAVPNQASAHPEPRSSTQANTSASVDSGVFSADADALTSIMTHTGVQPPRRVPIKRATLAPSAKLHSGHQFTQRVDSHNAEIENATRAIERLQLKRMSLHSRMLPLRPDDVPEKPMVSFRAAPPLSSVQQSDVAMPPRTPRAVGEWVSGSSAALIDLIQHHQQAHPRAAIHSSVRRHTMAPVGGLRGYGAAPLLARFERSSPFLAHLIFARRLRHVPSVAHTQYKHTQ